MEAGQLTRRVTLQRRPIDDNGDQQPWEDVATRWAKVQPLVGGEAVKEQRLAGRQPVVITVRRDTVTRGADNAWRAYDARLPAPPSAEALIWNVTSVIWNQLDGTLELLAIDEKSGASG